MRGGPIEGMGEILKALAARLALPAGASDSAPASSDDSESRASCPICADRRWVRPDVAPGEPGFGQPRRCPACGPLLELEQLRARLARLSADCGLSAMHRRQDFAAFERYAGNERAWEAARAFAAEPGREWLVLSGEPGVGKTHLLAAIANAVLAQGQAVIYAHVPDLLDWLRQGYEHERGGGDQDGDFAARFARIQRVPLLLLDDLAAERPTEWVREQLCRLVDYRYREELAMAVTTNLDVAQVRRLSERIYSRLERYEWGTVAPNQAEPYHRHRRGSRG